MYNRKSWNVKKASAQSNQGVDIDPELHFDNLESDKTYLFNLDTECFSIEFDETDTAYKRILQQREIIKQRRCIMSVNLLNGFGI
ncbi:hypothetical protein RO3G_15955 [Rhizopus delemar RA 99-880]|uniref:Uncharacterized protein n=1 Tax=Rhizopus delemar (strain RA 99-880 / ATCC MYA-4621 / FGSC 9543 / NRRL 43880) TaxID=246409 RepID=I1CS14_RHIO9|nr:hypothetical protein RO3G_15955 [Rhizopus delemar RA 99-880]|eukprot:EIE91244.1 hypothetical protein RO3G_15955 [Rhizopus delemar RA 99-880]